MAVIKIAETERVKKAQERILNYRKVYYLENFEHISNYGKVWRLEHPEYMSNYSKVWRLGDKPLKDTCSGL